MNAPLPKQRIRYDQLAAIRAFARVVETGTFTRAAASLEMPKATVTKLIQTLESHLHTRLLNRTTRRVIVTPDGAAYYERVVRLLAELDELDGSMTLSQASPKGRLRVDVSAALALLVIVPALPEFHARYPEIQLDLGVSDQPVDLIAENVDCVVRGGALADQSLIARRIGQLRFITAAAPSYLARHGEPRHPRDLEGDGHTVVGYFKAGSGRAHPFTFAKDGEHYEIKGRHIVAVNDGNAYVAAGLVGLGVVQAPSFMVQHHLETGALRSILDGWTSHLVPVHIVYPPNRHLSSKVRIFVDWIAELFAGGDLTARARLMPPGR
ncbi:MAG TPA: LysR family transcriptional regulator [Alphaproteobacteria bacterium]|nr:LysR family transcriptional regulator [Alphaproteobacteria bacterium]